MTEQQLHFLRNNAHRYTRGELAAALGVCPTTIWSNVKKLGLQTKPHSRQGRTPMGLPCPECDRKGRTIETRAQDGTVRRRYQCTQGHRWSTWESYREDGDE